MQLIPPLDGLECEVTVTLSLQDGKASKPLCPIFQNLLHF